MDIEQLLDLSNRFSEHLASFLEDLPITASAHFPAATAAALSLEHAGALRLLFSAGAPQSACALLRLQYEALLRGAWLIYAAPAAASEKLSASLEPDSQQAAKNVAGAKTMLEQLQKSLEANPALLGLVKPLAEIRDVSWDAMNSFVHAGLHPLVRTSEGFPHELAANVVRQSNAMQHMAARLLARLSDDSSGLIPRRVDSVWMQYEGCLPMASARS
ncbi:DUF6988 family protein [Ramlibacter sp. MMS24-I3-19]|uniref:DUF6988 family protein n=1 Tax=Ramlibacter sp. MMS24-I3-19 TaxID=3416606 RepID=UPI003D04A399